MKPVCMWVAGEWICPHQEAASGQEEGQDLESCLDQARDRLCGYKSEESHLVLNFKKNKYQNRHLPGSWEFQVGA